MARTEKDFLNTLETYVKITQDRLRDGRIIDAHDELGLIEVMIDQRRQEVEGTAAWVQKTELREYANGKSCNTCKLRLRKNGGSEQNCNSCARAYKDKYEADEETWEKIQEKAQPTLEALKEHPWESHYSLEEMVERQTEPEEDFGAEMLKKLTEE